MQSPHLIVDGSVTKNDWHMLSDTETLPDHGKVVVSLKRWQSEAESLRARPVSIGILLSNLTSVHDLAPALLEQPLLILDFPIFADGRAYSQAKQLRMIGYRGELRATGAAVVLDQIRLMSRCGINSFDLRPDQDGPACVAALRAGAPDSS